MSLVKTARRPFPRRTKATSAPETTEEITTEFETTPAPGPSKFKLRKAAEAARKEAAAFRIENQASQKEAEASQKEKEASRIEDDAFRKEAARNNTGRGSKRPSQIASAYRKEAQESRKQAEVFRKEAGAYRKEAEESRRAVERNETRIADRGPVRASQAAAARRNERPTTATRNFVRRRLGGGDGLSTTVATPPASVTRRTFRIASRRRPATSSTTTTEQPITTQPTTLIVESEELIQDIEDIDAIEDPTLEPRASKKDSKIQRRPLVNLRDDQNPSATNEDERTRQSKKYSSTFRQNQLDTLLKEKSGEVTTEAGTTIDETAETALAIATHQLITAPLPSTDSEATSRYNTEYTSSDTEYTKTPYEEYTTAFRTAPTQDFVQTTIGEAYSVYDTPRVTTDDFRTTAYLTTDKSRRPYSTTNYEEKTTYELPKTTIRQSSETTDIDPGKVTLETFPSTIQREGYTNSPTDFDGFTQTTFEAPKLSTLSRYPTTPAYQTVTNQYLPSTRGYTETVTNEYVSTTRDYTDTTDPTSYSSPRFIEAKAVRGFSSPNVITPGYTGVQRGGIKYETDKYSTIPENTDTTVRTRYSTTPVEDTRSTRIKYTTVAEDVGSTVGYSSSNREPTGFFTRDYILESPVTKSYDEKIQYLSTTPQTTPRKVFRKKIQRRISTTIRPTTSTVRSTTRTYVPEVTTPRPTLRPRQPTKKPFEKIAKDVPNRTFRPVVNYDYYDDSAERVALKYAEGTKVILHGKGSIECLDVGNFPHPSSCKKFISCARMEFGSLLGWEYVCPQGLSFDPVGGICNWSAGLGCEEKDP